MAAIKSAVPKPKPYTWRFTSLLHNCDYEPLKKQRRLDSPLQNCRAALFNYTGHIDQYNKNALLRTNAQATYDLVPRQLIAKEEVLVLVKKCIGEIEDLSLATSFSEIDHRISLNESSIDIIKSVTINLLRSTFNGHLGGRVPKAQCTENTRKACKFLFDYFDYGSTFFKTPTKESVFNEFHPINPNFPLVPPILDEVD